MKITKVKIKNYKSIIENGLDLSHSDNIVALIGQNESGKSSILEALRDFYKTKFDPDSLPYPPKNGNGKQQVDCFFEMQDSDREKDCESIVINHLETKYPNYIFKFEKQIFDKVSAFSIVFDGSSYSLDGNLSKIIQNCLKWEQREEHPESLPESPVEAVPPSIEPVIGPEVIPVGQPEIIETPVEAPDQQETAVDIKEATNPADWNELHSEIADLFVKGIIPEIIFFEGGECDMLPPFISSDDLSNKTGDGWIAVDRLQRCLQESSGDINFSFDNLFGFRSIQRRGEVNKQVDRITADFKEDFSQKIHGIEGDNLSIIFNAETRQEDGDSEHKNYLDFAVQTKEDEPLPLKMRSKGMIWFLSFWLALKSLKEKKSIILIDEPDRNLHINAQRDLFGIFKKISEKFGHQIIYATHAPALVPLDNIYRVYLVFNDNTKGTIVENILKTQIGNSKNKQEAISLVNYAIGCEVPYQNMVFEKKNVILEGSSDYMHFVAMGKALKKNLDYVFIPGVGTKGSKLNPLVGICIGYNLNWCVILDGDVAGTEKYDDIKESVFDNDDSEARKKIMNLNKDKTIEDLFTIDDVKQIANGSKSFQLGKSAKKNNLSLIGSGRKNIFAKLFLEKVTSGEIKKDNLSDEVVKNFEELFSFIETSLKDQAAE